eukprot:g18916.t1
MVVPVEEAERLKKIMCRIKFDQIRMHPFPRAPHLPLVKNVTSESIGSARMKLKKYVSETGARSREIKQEIDEAINKPRACSKLGLWEKMAMEFNHAGDTTSWEVWRDGLDCVGECKVPPGWEDKEKKDKCISSVEDFEESKVIRSVMQGKHVKPVWGERLIQRTWGDCIKETKVVPELGYSLLEGPFDITDPEEIKYAFRRFPREQKANKIRLIDPAIGANKCSPLTKRVPIPSAHDIHVNAAVAHDPSMAGMAVVMHNRKIIKKCRKAEKRYESQLIAWCPTKSKYQWFQAVTAIFGSRHSVTGWGRNGKTIRSIKRGMYGLNSEDYVDDFPSFVGKGMGKCVTEALLELLEELGLPAMMEKVEFGEELEILGLMFSVLNGAPEVFITEKRRELIKKVCAEARESGSVDAEQKRHQGTASGNPGPKPPDPGGGKHGKGKGKHGGKGEGKEAKPAAGWKCPKCNAQNFADRKTRFKCDKKGWGGYNEPGGGEQPLAQLHGGGQPQQLQQQGAPGPQQAVLGPVLTTGGQQQQGGAAAGFNSFGLQPQGQFGPRNAFQPQAGLIYNAFGQRSLPSSLPSNAGGSQHHGPGPGGTFGFNLFSNAPLDFNAAPEFDLSSFNALGPQRDETDLEFAAWQSRRHFMYGLCHHVRGGGRENDGCDLPGEVWRVDEGCFYRAADAKVGTTSFRSIDDSGASTFALPVEQKGGLATCREFDRAQKRGTASKTGGVTVYGDGILVARPAGMHRWIHIYVVVGDFGTALSPTIALFQDHNPECIPTRYQLIDHVTGQFGSSIAFRNRAEIEWEVQPGAAEAPLYAALAPLEVADPVWMRQHEEAGHYPHDAKRCGACRAGLIKNDPRSRGAVLATLDDNCCGEEDKICYIVGADVGGQYPADPVYGRDHICFQYDYGSQIVLGTPSKGKAGIFEKGLRHWLRKPWKKPAYWYPDNAKEAAESQKVTSLLRENTIGMVRVRSYRKVHGGVGASIGAALAGARILVIASGLPSNYGIRAVGRHLWIRNRTERTTSSGDKKAPLALVGEPPTEIAKKRDAIPFGTYCYGLPAMSSTAVAGLEILEELPPKRDRVVFEEVDLWGEPTGKEVPFKEAATVPTTA